MTEPQTNIEYAQSFLRRELCVYEGASVHVLTVRLRREIQCKVDEGRYTIQRALQTLLDKGEVINAEGGFLKVPR